MIETCGRWGGVAAVGKRWGWWGGEVVGREKAFWERRKNDTRGIGPVGAGGGMPPAPGGMPPAPGGMPPAPD